MPKAAPKKPRTPKVTIAPATTARAKKAEAPKTVSPKVVSTGNKEPRVRIKPVEEVPTPPPPPIETEAELPARRTRIRKPLKVIKDEDSEDRMEGEHAANFVPRAVRRTRKSAEPVRPAATDPVETGSRFVRMLNRQKRIVGVIANYVPERMTEGYRFIIGESVIPTRTGPEDSCPGLRKIQARDYDWPQNAFDAIELWRDAMLDDLDDLSPAQLAGRDHEGIIRRLTGILQNPSTYGMVYGSAPTGKVAESLGYGS